MNQQTARKSKSAELVGGVECTVKSRDDCYGNRFLYKQRSYSNLGCARTAFEPSLFNTIEIIGAQITTLIPNKHYLIMRYHASQQMT